MSTIIANALYAVAGNAVLQGGRLRTGEAMSLEEMVQPADREKGLRIRDHNMVKDILDDGSAQNYPICSTDLPLLGKYGVGLELYFRFVKQLAWLFFVVSLISLWPLLENYWGEGLHEKEDGQFYDQFTIANQDGVTDYQVSVDSAEDEVDEITSNQLRLVTADFLYSCVFFLFILYYYIRSVRVVKRNYQENVTVSDYAVQVNGLPRTIRDASIVKQHFEQFGKVIEVTLARKYNDLLDDYLKRAEVSYELAYEQQQPNSSLSKIQKLQAKIAKFDLKISKNPQATLKHEELPVDRAFVVFNEVKARKLCIKAYSRPKGMILKRLSRLRRQRPGLKLNGVHRLRVSPITEPSNIHWENLEVTRWSRFFRRCVSYIVTLIILAASVVMIFYLKNIENDLPTEEECAALGITEDMELTEVVNETDDTIVNCFCKHQSWSDLLDDPEISDLCDDYVEQVTTANIIRVASSVGVVLINFILKLVLRALSRFERMPTVTKEQVKIMSKVFLAMFINTAIIALLVNADFHYHWDALPAEWFEGDYPDFTRTWFTTVGATVTLTMLISIVSPHMLHILISWPLGCFKRKCCWKRYKTQHRMNVGFRGGNLDLSTKVSQVLNIVFTCFLYSGGIPFLNICCFVALVCIYWSEKTLTLRHYARPPFYSESLNESAIELLPLALFFHALFSMYMYGSESIFPEGFESTGANSVKPEEATLEDRVSRVSGILCLIWAGLALVLYFWLVPIGNCIRKRFRAFSRVDDVAKVGQRSFENELGTIKEFGLHTYEITANPTYRPLVDALNAAAAQLRDSPKTLNKTVAWEA